MIFHTLIISYHLILVKKNDFFDKNSIKLLNCDAIHLFSPDRENYVEFMKAFYYHIM